jgi:hypothetical protein
LDIFNGAELPLDDDASREKIKEYNDKRRQSKPARLPMQNISGSVFPCYKLQILNLGTNTKISTPLLIKMESNPCCGRRICRGD